MESSGAALGRWARWGFAMLVASLLLSPLLAEAAQAQEEREELETPGGWFFVPARGEGQAPASARSFFFYELRPGQVIEDAVQVGNPTEQTLNFHVHAADGYNTEQGAFALRDGDDPQEGVGAWIEFGASSVTVQPGQMVEVPFVLRVPQDVEPGDHSGGVRARNIDLQERVDGGDIGLEIQRSLGLAVHTRIEGPVRPSVSITDVTASASRPLIPYVTSRGQAEITYEVRNSGNVRVTPEIEIEVTGLFGREVRTFPAHSLSTLLPGESATNTVVFEGLPPLDLLRAQVTANVPEHDLEATGTTRLVAFSWLMVVLLLLAIGGLWWWRRRRGGPEPPLEETLEPSEREPVGAR